MPVNPSLGTVGRCNLTEKIIDFDDNDDESFDWFTRNTRLIELVGCGGCACGERKSAELSFVMPTMIKSVVTVELHTIGCQV